MDSPRPITIRAHDDGVNRWRMAEARPASALARHVRSYSAYDETTTGFTARRELASTGVVVIFNLGAPVELTGADGAAIALDAGEAFAAGFADGTSISRSGGSQSGIHIFMPWATLGRLCGCPVSEVANRVVRLDDLIGGRVSDLGGRLMEAGNDGQRFALLDAFVMDRLGESEAMDGRITAAVARLRARPDKSIRALADWAGWSPRHFLQRFRDETGLAPARFARLARFEHFTAAIAADPDARLADIAQDSGFYDEPHLAREVRAFAGVTPGELRARIIPGGGGFVDS
ncbi:AraC family transcriptional regulator [Sphingobium phenoxybenzoativorans]|uniref:AraC family transcriptional regulator n=1 Tax=Sphingobium phenoxybenzoativorans TaxID=1592790 RepID=A0A975K7B8_9SPHN|nr:helix-turn-helix domain-containing protein [Sphingobium phenoxybenzoativorans]QUT06143.1 AraC family transcriptional regulator [Sphingobium phenoxybenzoativorans]